MTLDDVPIGIVLQEVTPFRFDCTRLWMEPIAEIYLPLRNIPFIINAQVETLQQFFKHLNVITPKEMS